MANEVKLALARRHHKVTLQLEGCNVLWKYLSLMLIFGRTETDTLWTTKRNLPSLHFAHISKWGTSQSGYFVLGFWLLVPRENSPVICWPWIKDFSPKILVQGLRTKSVNLSWSPSKILLYKTDKLLHERQS